MLSIPPSESLARPIDVIVSGESTAAEHTNSAVGIEAGYRLLIETPSGGSGPREIDTLVVSRTTRALSMDALGRVRLLDAAEDAACGDVVQLETIARGARTALLLATPPGSRLRVNGLPAAPLALLAVGDVLQLGASLAHVSYQRAPQIGVVPEALVGERCPVCRLPVEADALVVVHDCNRPIHCERDESRLQCARVSSECAHCEQTISLEPGLAYWPEA